MYELFDICYELGYKIDVYSGDIKSMTFYDKYAAMSDEEKIVNKKNVILANFVSGSTGINWQLYNKCIIASVPVYKDYAQGIKRLHRIGQKDTVIYHIFHSDNWLDRGMLKALSEGIQYTEDLFEDELKEELIK